MSAMATYELKTDERWGVTCKYSVEAGSLEEAKKLVTSGNVGYDDFDVYEDTVEAIEEDDS